MSISLKLEDLPTNSLKEMQRAVSRLLSHRTPSTSVTYVNEVLSRNKHISHEYIFKNNAGLWTCELVCNNGRGRSIRSWGVNKKKKLSKQSAAKSIKLLITEPEFLNHPLSDAEDLYLSEQDESECYSNEDFDDNYSQDNYSQDTYEKYESNSQDNYSDKKNDVENALNRSLTHSELGESTKIPVWKEMTSFGKKDSFEDEDDDERNENDNTEDNEGNGNENNEAGNDNEGNDNEGNDNEDEDNKDNEGNDNEAGNDTDDNDTDDNKDNKDNEGNDTDDNKDNEGNDTDDNDEGNDEDNDNEGNDEDNDNEDNEDNEDNDNKGNDNKGNESRNVKKFWDIFGISRGKIEDVKNSENTEETNSQENDWEIEN